MTERARRSTVKRSLPVFARHAKSAPYRQRSKTLVDDVTREIFNTLEQEVTTIRIGEMVMKRLKDLDEVAYVRFASVYRSFKDINTFMEELKSLLGESEENKDDSAENPKAD